MPRQDLFLHGSALRRHGLAALIFSLAFLSLFPTVLRAQVRVDLELLLAVDVSDSVDAREYAVQAEGLAAAFRDPAVRDAIRRGSPRGIAVCVVQWAGGREPMIVIDWARLDDDLSIAAFAEELEAMPRLFVGTDTWLGQAVRFGARALLSNDFTAPRQAIDLSADGGSESIGLTRQARDSAVAAGLVINGLAIENDDPGLHRFFRDNLIGGAGAFAMKAASYDDFAEVMRQKLLREIGERPLASLAP